MRRPGHDISSKYSSGVMAAVAAGMRAIGYAADSDERALRDAGAEIIRSLDKLPELLGLLRA
jgi:beta-phosphoglucomutase-like phosphatase (HAD superfamily)